MRMWAGRPRPPGPRSTRHGPIEMIRPPTAANSPGHPTSGPPGRQTRAPLGRAAPFRRRRGQCLLAGGRSDSAPARWASLARWAAHARHVCHVCHERRAGVSWQPWAPATDGRLPPAGLLMRRMWRMWRTSDAPVFRASHGGPTDRRPPERQPMLPMLPMGPMDPTRIERGKLGNMGVGTEIATIRRRHSRPRHAMVIARMHSGPRSNGSGRQGEVRPLDDRVNPAAGAARPQDIAGLGSHRVLRLNSRADGPHRPALWAYRRRDGLSNPERSTPGGMISEDRARGD
jgi:hypothetical protein